MRDIALVVSLWDTGRGNASERRLAGRRFGKVANVPTSIDLAEVLRLTEDGASLVEVLPEAEYRQIHPAGAINLPLKKLNAETAKQLDRSAPVIVYCNDFL